MCITYSPIAILYPSTHIWNTALTACPVHTVLSLCQIPSRRYGTHNTDHMSSTCSPITILDSKTHIRNAEISKHKLTTSAICPVQSQYYIPPPICGSHNTDYMSNMSSAMTTLTKCPVSSLLYLTIHGWNTHHCPICPVHSVH